MQIKDIKFPDGFLWGASTAAHQAEGNNINDWSEWEFSNANRLANEGREKFSYLWGKKLVRTGMLREEVVSPTNYVSGVGVDQYHLFDVDLSLMVEMSHNVHRLSLEWSRVEPEEGRFIEEEIDHYRQIVKALRKKNIEPFVTLWHFTDPLWIRDIGGWKSKKTIEFYLRYVERIVTELKDDVKFWVTINEPEVIGFMSYFMGEWPPQEKSLISYFKVNQNFVKAHREAYDIIKKISPDAQVSIAKNCASYEAVGRNPINHILKFFGGNYETHYFMSQIRNKIDFIGLNYYFNNRIDWWYNQNLNVKISDLGWDLTPRGIYHVLKNYKSYGKPIYITENGLADAADTRREWFLKESLAAIHKAIEEGVDVRGYMHWSFIDNFEWDKGYWPRFGLVEVDYKTKKRTIRNSARVYSDIIRNNGFEVGE